MTVYRDFDMNLAQDENGQLVILEDADSIKQAMKLLIMTRLGEMTKFNSPRFGSKIYNYLGEKISFIVGVQLEDELKLTISNYEPRVSVLNLTVTPDASNNMYNIQLTYIAKSTNNTDVLSFNVELIK